MVVNGSITTFLAIFAPGWTYASGWFISLFYYFLSVKCVRAIPYSFQNRFSQTLGSFISFLFLPFGPLAQLRLPFYHLRMHFLAYVQFHGGLGILIPIQKLRYRPDLLVV